MKWIQKVYFIYDLMNFFILFYLGLLSLQLISTRTSYYTISEKSSRQETRSDGESLVKYFSITSSAELITPPLSTEQLPATDSLQKRTTGKFYYDLSKKSLNNEKNNSSNYIVLDIERFERINLLNNASKM